VLRRLAGSVRELTDRVLDLGAKRVQWRVWVELLRLARLTGITANVARIEKMPTHQEIASHVGTSREEVTREFSRLNREGIAQAEGRVLIIATLQHLRDCWPIHARTNITKEDIPTHEPHPVDMRQRRAILVAEALDAVGMMERDEERTVSRWRTFLSHATSETVPTHAGRSFSRVLGHGFVAEFPDGRHALKCAFELTSFIGHVETRSSGLPR
jgi:hypothetical protein